MRKGDRNLKKGWFRNIHVTKMKAQKIKIKPPWTAAIYRPICHIRNEETYVFLLKGKKKKKQRKKKQKKKPSLHLIVILSISLGGSLYRVGFRGA